LIKQKEEYRDNREAANEVALTNLRMKKGVKELREEWEKYGDILSDTSASEEEKAEAEAALRDSLNDILNLEDN
jgi:hypothetical protein